MWNDWHKKGKERFLAAPPSTKRIVGAHAGAIAVCMVTAGKCKQARNREEKIKNNLQMFFHNASY